MPGLKKKVGPHVDHHYCGSRSFYLVIISLFCVYTIVLYSHWDASGILNVFSWCSHMLPTKTSVIICNIVWCECKLSQTHATGLMYFVYIHQQCTLCAVWEPTRTFYGEFPGNLLKIHFPLDSDSLSICKWIFTNINSHSWTRNCIRDSKYWPCICTGNQQS